MPLVPGSAARPCRSVSITPTCPGWVPPCRWLPWPCAWPVGVFPWPCARPAVWVQRRENNPVGPRFFGEDAYPRPASTADQRASHWRTGEQADAGPGCSTDRAARKCSLLRVSHIAASRRHREHRNETTRHDPCSNARHLVLLQPLCRGGHSLTSL